MKSAKIICNILCISFVMCVFIAYIPRHTDSDFFSQKIETSPQQVHTAMVPDPLIVGWVGDMVPSDSPAFNTNAFTNVTSLLQKPTLMMGNLEGTFAHLDRYSKCQYMSGMCFAFRGDAGFADNLKAAGFDFVSLVNNHSYDYGEDGLKDTEAELNRVGLPYIAPNKPTTSIVVSGKHIGILGLSSTQPAQTITDYDFITKTIERLKKENDIVIVIFHGGAEGSDQTNVSGETEYMGTENRGNVELVAHTAIDAGAALVLGSGPHVLRKIEWYKNKPIAYSLGNFVGGNQRLTTTGILSWSGIFTTTFSANKNDTNSMIPTDTNFTSIILSKDGTPSPDPLDQGKQLVESLSTK